GGAGGGRFVGSSPHRGRPPHAEGKLPPIRPLPPLAKTRELGCMTETSSNAVGLHASGDRQACVLVVEDDPSLQRMILNYFEDNNISTLLASGREQMVRQLGSAEGDLVVLDLRLGQEDGLDLLREVRSGRD